MAANTEITVRDTALPASGQHDAPTGTMSLTGKQRPADQKTIDLKPRGESVGDRMLSSETLRRDGRQPHRSGLRDPRRHGPL